MIFAFYDAQQQKRIPENLDDDSRREGFSMT